MFNAEILTKDLSNGVATIVTKFTSTSGRWTQREVKVPSIEDYKNWVRSTIKELEGAEALNDSLPVGSVDLTKPSPATPTPTQADLDQAAWIADYYKLASIQKLVVLGVLTGNEVATVNLRDKIKAGFKPAYLDFVK